MPFSSMLIHSFWSLVLPWEEQGDHSCVCSHSMVGWLLSHSAESKDPNWGSPAPLSSHPECLNYTKLMELQIIGVANNHSLFPKRNGDVSPYPLPVVVLAPSCQCCSEQKNFENVLWAAGLVLFSLCLKAFLKFTLRSWSTEMSNSFHRLDYRLLCFVFMACCLSLHPLVIPRGLEAGNQLK